MGRPIVPREHGAWAALYGSYLAGVGVAGWITFPLLLLLMGVTAAAFANGALTLWLRPVAGQAHLARRRRALAWSLVYSGLAVTALLPLALVFRMFFLIPFGAGAACSLLLRGLLVRGRSDRSLVGELTGTAGLTMVAPVAHAVVVGEVQPVGAVLWLLLFLFFASAVFRVRMRLHRMFLLRKGGNLPEPGLIPCLAYHVLLIILVPLLAILHVIPWATLLAFAPAVWRAAAGLRDDGVASLDVMRLGWSEVALAATFVLLLVGAFHFTSLAG